MEPTKIPRLIDDPPHVLLWSADELAPMALGLTFGIFLGQAMIFFLIGLLVTNLYRRYRDNHPDGYLLHMLYWGGFLFSKSRSLRNPYVRSYLP